MSALPATARSPRPDQPRTLPTSPARTPGKRTPKTTPALRVVPPRRTAARAPFVLLVSLLLGGGLVLVLLVNTWLAQGSFRLHALQLEQSSLADQTQAMSQTIADESTPQSLAARAAALGMVAAPNPVFRRPDGAVLGAATKAVAPRAVPTPTLNASAAPTPSGSATASSSAAAKPTAKPTTASAGAKPTPSAGSKPSAGPSTRPSAGPSAGPSARPSSPPPTHPAATPSGGHR